MHVVTNIDSNTLDGLKALARANVDSSISLEEAARSVENNGLGSLFLTMAQRRRGNVEALRSYLQFSEGEYEIRGSLRGKLHRWWLHLRASMQHENTLAVVTQAERSEAAIKHAYERILVKLAGISLYDVLHSQYREVLQNHERIKDIEARLADMQG